MDVCPSWMEELDRVVCPSVYWALVVLLPEAKQEHRTHSVYLKQGSFAQVMEC